MIHKSIIGSVLLVCVLFASSGSLWADSLSEQRAKWPADEWMRLFNNPGPDDVNMKATGYDWIGYITEEKIALIDVLFDLFNLDREIYDVEAAVFNFEVQYFQFSKMVNKSKNLKYDDYLSMPCLQFFMLVLEDRESDWGAKALTKEAKKRYGVDKIKEYLYR